MTDYDHGSIVALPLKIAVKQAGDYPGMSPNNAGVVIKTPTSFYSVRMHYEDASIHPRMPKFSDSFYARAERAVVATKAFRPAVL